jgi:photosystem II stability/assembly factor-like uncharacterized protein
VKKLLLSSLWLLLHSFAVQSSAQCYSSKWLNPLPTGNALFAMWMLSPDTVFIGGERGTLLRTTDGGKSWATIELPTDHQVVSMQFVNSKTGYASAVINNSSQVLKTSDGGSSWTIVFDGYTNSLYGFVKDLQFLTVDTGYVYFGASRVLKTTDAGKNWSVLNLPSSGEGCIYFLDTKKGFAGGYNGDVLRTLDGGKTWTSIKISGFSSSNRPRDIYFSGNQYGWAVGLNNEMARTTDGGQTWKQVATPGGAGNKLFFFAADAGLALNSYSGNYLYMTTDSGKTWKQKMIPDYTTLEDIQFRDSIGYAVSVYGDIYKSTDKGLTWKRVSLGFHTYLYSMVNDGAGHLFAGGSGAVYKSVDSGGHWDTVFSTTSTVYSLFFTDSLYGWMDGTNGLFRRTTDGGKTWQKASSGLSTSQNFFAIFFKGRDTGYAGGANGAVYYTVDGGKNWTGVTTNTTETIHELYFTDTKTGYAAGSNGLMMRTTDGGKTWKILKTGKTSFLSGLWFMNAARGFAAGQSGLLLSTVDSGNHWTATYPGWGDDIQRLYFVNNAVGYMVQSNFNGIIYGTVDSGKSWQLVASPTGAYLFDLTVLNGNIFVCGSTGKLLKITLKLNPPAVHDQSRCGAGKVLLIASAKAPSKIRWYDSPAANAKLLQTGDTLLTSSLSQTTIYYADAFDSVAQCASTRVPVKAVIHPAKIISLDISASTDTLCAGTAVQFSSLTNAAHVLSYTWKRNANIIGKDSAALQLSDLMDKDSVWLELRTADECQTDSLTVSAKKIFKVSTLPKAGFGINDAEQCFKNNRFVFYNSSTSADANSLRTWTINGKLTHGIDTVTVSFNKPGTYPVKLLVVNKYGCMDSIEKPVQVFKDPQTGSIMGDSLVKQHTTISYSVPSTTGSVYQWWVAKGSGSSTNPSININWTDTGIGSIKVLEISADGCIGDTVRMRVRIKPAVSIAPVIGPGSIKVYPSPAADWLNIQTDRNLYCRYQLYEMSGRIVSIGDIKNGNLAVDVQSLPDGIYFLRISSPENGAEIYQCKVIIRH